MAGRMLIIAIVGLIGIVAPFVIANKTLDLFYSRAVTGSGAPIWAAIAGFGAATLIAGLVFYIVMRTLQRLRDVPHPEVGIDEPEELPE